VGAWCWQNFDILSGVSFLPKADDAHIYQAAPYEEISLEEYTEMRKKTDFIIDWDKIIEQDDNTIGSQELACVADMCEI
jgi:ribonucleoside-diphosphate reductase alpha chain